MTLLDAALSLRICFQATIPKHFIPRAVIGSKLPGRTWGLEGPLASRVPSLVVDKHRERWGCCSGVTDAAVSPGDLPRDGCSGSLEGRGSGASQALALCRGISQVSKAWESGYNATQ